MTPAAEALLRRVYGGGASPRPNMSRVNAVRLPINYDAPEARSLSTNYGIATPNLGLWEDRAGRKLRNPSR